MNSVLYKPPLYDIEKGDVTLLIDPERPNWIAVNRAGVEVLELCDGRKTVEEIIETLKSRYSKEDIRRFIDKARSCEIIGTKPSHSIPYHGRYEYIHPEEIEELWVYVTNNCNLHCKHCLIRGGEISKNELTTEELKGVFRDAVDLGLKRIFFTGGEPFLRTDLFELIECVAKEIGLELVIMTNGTLLDEEKVKRLAKFPGIVLQVSLEGSREDVNDKIRGFGAYSNALNGIELLRAHGIHTIVASTATRTNIDDISNLNDLLHEKGVKTHHILWVHNRGRAKENNVSVSTDDLTKLMLKLKDKGLNVDNWNSFTSRVYGGRETKVDGCHATYSSLSIDSNGDIYPCPSLNGDTAFLMGNIKQGLKEAWLTSEIADNLRKTSVSNIEACKNCVFRFICGGGCRCQAYYSTENPTLISKDPYCEVTKAMIIESMMSFVTPNGQSRPEILWYMKREAVCDSKKQGKKKVSPFHCTCVLDIADDKHQATKQRYRKAANKPENDLCCPTGYSAADINNIPADTISVSYGCGNPTAFTDLKLGENVLDIGSGGGIDCFIAAKKVGDAGKVIGVDMTEEMIVNANKNKEKMAGILGYDVVEFRKGLAENLPVESCSTDLVISNCVINLSPDKEKVFEEIYRVLNKGGMFSISDIVSDKEVPEDMKADDELWSGCISGALTHDDFMSTIRGTGFVDVSVERNDKWKEVGGICFNSITVRGKKP